MKTIVFTAQSFGFGPVSKMLAVSENLTNPNIKKIFFGTGVAYDLAKLHNFDEIHNFGHNQEQKIIDILKETDLFVNVMDFALGKLAKITAVPYFLIDSLFWFWADLPDGVREANIYFCQEFFGMVQGKIEQYKLEKSMIISPIVSQNFEKFSKKDQVMINFGGIENPFVEIGKNSFYPFIILKILLPILEKHFSEILVTGRQSVIQICKEKFFHFKNTRFNMLSQKEMLRELYRSQTLFTAPGIQTCYDAADKLPIFCLPPQNNSNVRNLEIFTKHVFIKHYLKWDELYKFPFNECLGDEKKEFELVLETISRFETDIEAQNYFRDKIEIFLKNRCSWNNLIKNQILKIGSIGNTGIQTITQNILSHLKTSKFQEISV